MQVGFVGTGAMGLPMARNLCRAGFHVVVYNRTRERAAPLEQEGARLVDRPADACRGTDVVVTMLADDRATEEVVLRDGDFLRSLGPEAVHVCASTISVALSERLAEEHARAGRAYVAAPVFGRPTVAEAGKLLIVVAGPSAAVERCRPVLEAMGDRIVVLGERAALAHVAKLAGNFLILSALEALSEVAVMVHKHGLPPRQFLEIMTSSYFDSPAYRTYSDLICKGAFEPPGFRLALALKDAGLVLAAAEGARAPMPLASLVRDHLLSAMARGYGELDMTALSLVIAQEGGLEGLAT